MANGFKILKETTVYQGVRAHVVVQEMQLPDGSKANWDMIKHNGAAAVVPVDEDGRIIMTRQYRSSIDGESLEIPAGVLCRGAALSAVVLLDDWTVRRGDSCLLCRSFKKTAAKAGRRRVH